MTPWATHFNLIDEPWIPVVDVGRVSLKRVLSDPSLRALGGTPTEKIALLKLLQAICQSAFTPQDIAQWRALGPRGLCDAALTYLEQWRDRFWLYGDRPFLQLPAVATAELKSFSTVLPQVSTGNTTVLTQGQCEQPLDDADKALLLVVQMSLALGGKKTDNKVVLTPGYQGKTNDKGKPATGKPGSALAFMGLLHSFFVGETLFETLWLNLFTQEDIAGLPQYPLGLGQAPWEAMPEGEDCPRAQTLKQSLMGRLVPLGRFCLLAPNGLHITEGIHHHNYKDGLYDPSVSFRRKDQKVLWADPNRRPWRELPALLAFIQSQSDAQAWECEQLRLVSAKLRDTVENVGIWSGGLRVSSNAGEQYVSGADDAVESLAWLSTEDLNEIWFNHYKTEMAELDALAKQLYGCVSKWCSEMKLDPKVKAPFATELFWQLCEREAQTLLMHCDEPEARIQLRRRFADYMEEAYAQTCPPYPARNKCAQAKCRPFTATYRSITTAKPRKANDDIQSTY